MSRHFTFVDVFGADRFTNNPLAVVAQAESLFAKGMQRMSSWLNLAETSFLLAPTVPDADYRVCIFSRLQELPFAGHPTLGAAMHGSKLTRMLPTGSSKRR